MNIHRNVSVLVIDDEVEMCNTIADILENAGYVAYKANDGKTGLEVFYEKRPNVVLLDLCMPKIDGMEVLKKMKQSNSKVPVIIITAYGKIRSAVEAIKQGAYDYFNKPFNNDEVVHAVQNACEEMAIREEIEQTANLSGTTTSLFEQMGYSHEVKALQKQIECVAATNFTVLIYGETGSGKELVARKTHELSLRKDKLFAPVDCGSIPANLIESELFGYEKGAFTGADKKRPGYFESASGGTLFLDEIGNLPMSMQSKLLRALQEKRIRRLGGNREIGIDARIIAAGNERLESLVESGRFRMDLYQRLNEFCINVPPLRKRKDDILFLCKRFLNITNRELNKKVRSITKEAENILLEYDWPGNVRELKNVIRRSVLLAKDTITPKHLSLISEMKPHKHTASKRAKHIKEEETEYVESIDLTAIPLTGLSLHTTVSKGVENIEKKLITDVLRYTGGNKSKAAKLLKIDYKTLYSKIRKYGIKISTITEIAPNTDNGKE